MIEISSWGREFQTGLTRKVKKNLERLVLDGGIINLYVCPRVDV